MSGSTASWIFAGLLTHTFTTQLPVGTEEGMAGSVPQVVPWTDGAASEVVPSSLYSWTQIWLRARVDAELAYACCTRSWTEFAQTVGLGAGLLAHGVAHV